MTTDVPPTSPDPLSVPQRFVARALNEQMSGRPLYPDVNGFWITARDVRVALSEDRVSAELVLWELMRARLVYRPLFDEVLHWATGELMHGAHRVAQTVCGPACSRCGHDVASHHGGCGECRWCGAQACDSYLMRPAA